VHEPGAVVEPGELVVVFDVDRRYRHDAVTGEHLG
jgi:hypothetical protein